MRETKLRAVTPKQVCSVEFLGKSLDRGATEKGLLFGLRLSSFCQHVAQTRKLEFQEPGFQGTLWGSHDPGLLPPTYFYVREK